MTEEERKVLEVFIAGQTFNVSRQELAAEIGEEIAEPEGRSLLRCIQRLAALPNVEGLALSQLQLHGGLYYTVIQRDLFSDEEESIQTFELVTDALLDFGNEIKQTLPGSFINLRGKMRFNRAEKILKRENRGELDLLGILHFID